MPDQPETIRNDPFGGRAPTSHERMTGRPWDASYHHGPAPWEIDGPQPAIVRVATAGGFRSPVLDAGCGSGENSLHLASLGLSVLGVDVAETALARAREKARQRGLTAEFSVADVYDLARLGTTFASVLDCGMFHTGDRDERQRYVTSIASVTETGALLQILCFAPGPGEGPHPVHREDLEACFTPASGWDVVTIEPERVLTRFHDADGAPAWLATLRRR